MYDEIENKENQVVDTEAAARTEEYLNDDTKKLAQSEQEEVLKIIANVILIIGILGSLIRILGDDGFKPLEVSISAGILISSIASWALLRVIAKISITLNEINAKLK